MAKRSEKKPGKSRLRRFGRRLLQLLVVAVVFLVVAVLGLQTPPGKRFIAGAVERHAVFDGVERIEVQDIGGVVPFNMTISAIRVSDSESVWLQVEDVTFRFSGLSLLRGNVYVKELTAKRVVVNRGPVLLNEPEPAPWRLPEVPQLPDFIRVDRLAVDQLVLGETLLGESGEFEIAAEYRPEESGDGQVLAATIERLDDDSTYARMRVAGSAETLSISVDARDTVYVPELLGVDGPAVIRVNAEGPFTEWDGTATVDLGDHRLIELEATLRDEKGTAFRLTGYADLLESLVGEDTIELAGGRFDVDVSGALSEDGQLSLEYGAVTSDRVRLTAQGTSHFDRETLSGALHLDYDDASAFLGIEDALPLSVELGVDGRWTEFALSLGALTGGERALDLTADVTLDEVIQLASAGTVVIPDALVQAYGLPTDIGEIGFVIDGDYDQESGRYRVLEAGIRNEHFSLDGNVETQPADEMLAAGLDFALLDATLLDSMIDQQVSGSATGRIAFSNADNGSSAQATVDIASLALDDTRMETATFSLDASGQSIWGAVAEGWSAELTGETSGIDSGDLSLKPVTITVEANHEVDGDILLSVLRVEQGPTVIESTGTVAATFESANMEVSARVSDVAPYAALADQEMHGTVELDVTAAYRSDEDVLVSGDVSTTVNGIRGVSEDVDRLLQDGVRLTGLYSVTETAVSATDVALASTDWSVGGTGSYDFDGGLAEIRAALDADLGAIALALGEFPAGGQATAHVTAQLVEDRIEGEADLQIEGGFYDQWTFGALRLTTSASGTAESLETNAVLATAVNGVDVSLDAAALVAGDRVEVTRAELSPGANRISATGWWSQDGADGALDVALNLRELESLGMLMEQTIYGTGSGSMTLVSTEGALDVEGSVTLSNVVSGETSVATVALDASIKDVLTERLGQVHVTVTDARAADVLAEMFEAQVDFRGSEIALTSSGNGIGMDNVPWEIQLDSELNLDEQVVTVAKLEGMLETYPLELQAPTRVSFADAAYSVDALQLAFGEGVVQGAGSLQEEVVSASLDWDGIPLSVSQLFGAPITSGQANGRIELSGSVDAPTGSASLNLVNMRTRQTETLQSGADVALNLTLSPTRLDWTAQADLSETSRVTAEGLLPLAASESSVYALQDDGAWTGSLSGTVDLADIPRLLDQPEHVASGMLDVSGQLAGTPGNPTFNAAATMAGASYENARLGTALTNAELELRATQDAAELVRFQAEDGVGGTVEGSGRMDFHDDGEFDYQARLQSDVVRLVHRDDITATSTLALTMAGDETAGEVTGEVFIDEAHYIVRPASSESVNELDVQYVNDPRYVEKPEAPSKQAEPPYAVALDIDLRFPGRVFVQAQDVFTEWEGDLRIHGTTAEALVTGELQPVRGHISFLGRRFTLDNESLVSVNTETNSAPYLNLAATTRRSGIQATLRIRGSLEELEFSMTSEPPLPNEEILARVLFGRGVSELSPVQGLQLARAVAVMSGKFEGVPFFSGPSRLPVVDTLDVTSGESGPSIAVGKYISDRVFVEMEPGTGSNESRVKVQIDATNTIAVESVVGSGNQTGLGVFFKYHY